MRADKSEELESVTGQSGRPLDYNRFAGPFGKDLVNMRLVRFVPSSVREIVAVRSQTGCKVHVRHELPRSNGAIPEAQGGR